MLLDCALGRFAPAAAPPHDTERQPPKDQPAISHQEALAFIARAGATLASQRAAAIQRDYDQELADIVRVPLINRVARELEVLDRTTPSTKRVYGADCKRFKEFCDIAQTSVRPASPEVVCHFLLEQADNGASPATVNRLLAAISLAHRAARCFDPTDDILVRATVQHISRAAKQAKPQRPDTASGDAATSNPDEPKGQ
jgi:hypothetical protein